MGQKKKQGKERLDKYYHLAKSQGYRARSAFKLIQLNKKFNFLEKSRVLIDLCAAPGGWLQVASKYMPVSSMIIGVDLAPIKPIPRVITHVEDITTDHCRSTLRKDLKDWKADVVLHDGAPNVGAAWIQDAFSQSELTLSALKLAVEFLNKGGTFVTKVFRSKDYNNLIWVFNQLFKRVEATKPPSSRNVSAEIFVVCRDFLAPKKLDPKFLDPKFVFKDVEVEEDAAQTQKASLNTLINPEKAAKKRHRTGYEEGDYTLHKTNSVLEFLAQPRESEAIVMLAKCHDFQWEAVDSETIMALLDEEVQDRLRSVEQQALLDQIRMHASTTDEIVDCLSDLKVLGRKDYKNVLKWRQTIYKSFFAPKKAEESAADGQGAEEADDGPKDSETIVAELESLESAAKTAAKRAKRKRLERLAKDRRRLQLNMTTPKDIGLEESSLQDLDGEDMLLEQQQEDMDPSKADLFDLRRFKNQIPVDTSMDAEEDVQNMTDSSDALTDLEGHADGLEDDDDASESDVALADLERGVDEMYDEYRMRKLAKNPKEKVKMIRSQEEEFKGFSDSEKSDASMSDVDQKSSSSDDVSDSSDDFMSEDEVMPVPNAEPPKQNDRVTKLWFDRPVFQGLDLSDDENGPEESKAEQDDLPEVNFDQEIEPSKESRRQQKAKESFDQDSEDENNERLEKAKEILSTAEALTLAIQMVQDGGRQARDVLDTYGYNRRAFNDEGGLPQWFLDDETKHNRPNLPISKEAVEKMRQRQRELDARPIKKIAEAKARKKFKASKKLDKLRKKMNTMLEEDGGGDDPEMGSKLGQISKIMRNALQKAKAQSHKKVQLVVARGSNRGNVGRPKGVKGRYKMVDPRMKKEMRAQKRQDQAKPGSKGRKGRK